MATGEQTQTKYAWILIHAFNSLFRSSWSLKFWNSFRQKVSFIKLTFSLRLTRLLRLISLAHRATKLLFSLAQGQKLLASGNWTWIFPALVLKRIHVMLSHYLNFSLLCFASLFFTPLFFTLGFWFCIIIFISHFFYFCFVFFFHLALARLHSDWLFLFVNEGLTHASSLGITIVSLYCLDHRSMNFLTIVRVNREEVRLSK